MIFTTVPTKTVITRNDGLSMQKSNSGTRQRSPTLALSVLDVWKGLTVSTYAVLGKSWGRSVWHLGFGRFDDNERWWIAVEYPLSSQLRVIADRLSGKDGYASFCIYWSLNEKVELGIALGIPNKGQNEQAILLNFSWTP